jgi:hypothetical protein
MPQRVRQYHCLWFDDTISAALWADGLAAALASPAAYGFLARDARAVIWRVLPHGTPRRPGRVYLSEGALHIARELKMRLGLRTRARLDELPNGLSLLIGHRADAEAYADRHRPGASTRKQENG